LATLSETSCLPLMLPFSNQTLRQHRLL
jgi:hypothetical protein